MPAGGGPRVPVRVVTSPARWTSKCRRDFLCRQVGRLGKGGCRRAIRRRSLARRSEDLQEVLGQLAAHGLSSWRVLVVEDVLLRRGRPPPVAWAGIRGVESPRFATAPRNSRCAARD